MRGPARDSRSRRLPPVFGSPASVGEPPGSAVRPPAPIPRIRGPAAEDSRLELPQILHHVGALVTLLMGGLGLVRPDAAARLVGLEARARIGASELRATYGGLFTALGAFALLTRDEVAFALVGAGWLGAAAARVADAMLLGADRRVWRAALFEACVALLLLAPA